MKPLAGILVGVVARVSPCSPRGRRETLSPNRRKARQLRRTAWLDQRRPVPDNLLVIAVLFGGKVANPGVPGRGPQWVV